MNQKKIAKALVKVFGPNGLKIYEAGQKISDLQRREQWYVGLIEAQAGKKLPDHLKRNLKQDTVPVSVEKFLFDPFYLGVSRSTIYPEVLKAIVEINSGNYSESVLTGAIGTGKTTIAVYTQAYQLYVLSCYADPHALFGLDPSSEIVFIFQSLNERTAKAVDFNRFKALIEASPYFSKFFPFDKELQSYLKFPNRIEVKPVTGAETAAIGQNVFSGIIDEINFMKVVENSKNSVDGGTYDQAIALYNSISRRRKSRFLKMGTLPGVLCLVSSKRYPGQFTDQKEQEALDEIARTGRTSIYVYDKTTWDVKPPGSFTGKRFWLFVGDETRKPRILEEGEREKFGEQDTSRLVHVPEEYRTDFERDIINALRDIAGRSTLATNPFIVSNEAVAACFGKVESVFSRDSVDFVTDKLAIYPDKILNKQYPRWAHIDLGLTSDSAGLSIGYIDGFKDVNLGGVTEPLPNIIFDGVLEVRPPKGGEIIFSKIRDVLYRLREYGMDIRWVSLDSYQSVDTLQILRQQGFTTGKVSMDVSMVPYDMTKAAMMDGRLHMPEQPRARREFLSLERDEKKGKVDHPPNGSKDLADSVAGVVYGLSTRRELYVAHGIPLFRMPTMAAKEAEKHERSGKELHVGNLTGTPGAST